MSHVSELLRSSLIFGSIFTVLFGISISSLFLGFTKYDECPFQPLLPQGLLGFGFIGSICSIIALILVVLSFVKVDDSGTHLLYLLGAIIFVMIYGISAFILTSMIVFLFRTDYSHCQLENPTDLNPILRS
ncbi:unnamed protein product [Rotaria sordida]|uniref:Uncharacterized protein n=1 Tax=Rotaria sordida TaxID=392033 RepID=A0A814MS63_9BILA|nr:unnamed protein product [Rotaria sordida]